MKRMYVITRRDLMRNYQAVQAGHALAEFMLQYPTHALDWNNHTLIYLTVHNEQELRELWEKFAAKGHPASGFFEPDIGNQLTAVATKSIENGNDHQELTKDLRLL